MSQLSSVLPLSHSHPSFISRAQVVAAQAAQSRAPGAPSPAQELVKKARMQAELYEDRLLGSHSGSATAYESGMDHPSTNWAYGPGQPWRH